MGKKILFLMMFILMVGCAYAELFAEAEIVENSIYLDEQAVFNIYVENTDSFSKNLNMYTTDIKWYVDADPSPTKVAGDERKKFVITLIPSAWGDVGAQSVKFTVESPINNEKMILQLPVNVKSYDTAKKEYSPSVELRASFPEEIDPRNPIPLELYLRNRNRLEIDELKIIISSELFYEEKIIQLNALSETRENLQYTIDDDTKPIEDTLQISLSYNNRTINRERISYEVIPYAEFIEKQDNIQELFKKTTEYTITNQGNIKKKGDFRVDVSVLQNLFTKATPKPTNINIKEQYYEWYLDLQPNEEIDISVVRNYRPALYIFFISLVIVMIYFLYRSPILIRKESIVMGSTEQGISEMKVLLHLRNRSADIIENLTLIDLIPPIADLIKEDHLGTVSPSKILKHHKKGTIIKWEFDAIEPFEERIISYRIKTRMTVVGGITLPKAKIKFMKKDTERTVKSNKSQVSIGL